MSAMMTELELVGNPDDLMEFVSDLERAEGDLAWLIYSCAPAWGPRLTEPHSVERTRAFAGPKVEVALPQDIDFEEDFRHDPETLTLRFEHPHTLLREVICIGALFGFDLVVTIVDDENGWRERFSFEFGRDY